MVQINMACCTPEVPSFDSAVGRQGGEVAAQGMGDKKFGAAAIEDILCLANALGSLDEVVPRSRAAWSVSYPGLDSLPSFEGKSKVLRICIATEDIVGPVRNGGIGTTYAALAELLAKIGHDVTVLYLKGHEVENETIEHWLDYYAAKNILFVPVPNYARTERYSAGGDRWAHASYNMLRYLVDHPMDIVHVSEWRGGGYMSLLAKRQGLAFEDTLFIVKASSPWLWNRLYGLQPLERLDDLAKVYGERQSIELADMVIGGSLHLLRWMHSQGYRMPATTTFVQPNVAIMDHLRPLAERRSWSYRTRQPIDEFVFFGRLEARKGLLIFLHAIKRLLRQGYALPAGVTFLGKAGEPLIEGAGEVIAYIKSETSAWPTKIKILSDFQQYEALDYLLSGRRLAVMPSIIENSSLAVYEAALCRIPFIASDAGGTPELISPDDHPHALCAAHPVALAGKLAEAISLGGYVAAPSFDNAENLAQWKRFHLDLGRGLLPQLLQATQPAPVAIGEVSVCVYHAEADDRLVATLTSLKAQGQHTAEIMIAVDTEDDAAVGRVEATVAKLGLAATVLPAFDLDAGPAFNLLAERSQGDYLLFLWSGSILSSDALAMFSKVAACAAADVLTCFFRVVFDDRTAGRPYLSTELLGDVAHAFFHTDTTPLPLFVRSDVFVKLGGFTSDYRVLGHDHEFVAKARLLGYRCQTVLQELCSVDGWDGERLSMRGYGRSASEFRASRPHLAAAPLALRESLFMAKGLQKALGRRGRLGGSIAVRRGPARRASPVAAMLAALNPLLGRTRAAKRDRLERRARRAGAVQAGGAAGPVDGKSATGMQAVPHTRDLAVHWQTNDGMRYTGRVFGVHNGVVYGWVRSEDRPDNPVVVEGDLGGGRIRSIKANIASTAILPPRDGIRGHGFALPVWRGPKGFRGDWRSRDVVLRIKGTDIVISELSVPADLRALEASGFDGYCDLIDERIRGWVWQPAHPENSVDVAAFVDGKFLARATANAVRDDLRAQNIGTGAYGFMMAVPRSLRDGGTHRVDIVVADCGTLLKRGRLLLTGDSLAFAR